MASTLTQFNCRLSPHTIQQIAELASAMECSQADVVRQAVKLMARRERREQNKSAK